MKRFYVARSILPDVTFRQRDIFNIQHAHFHHFHHFSSRYLVTRSNSNGKRDYAR